MMTACTLASIAIALVMAGQNQAAIDQPARSNQPPVAPHHLREARSNLLTQPAGTTDFLLLLDRFDTAAGERDAVALARIDRELRAYLEVHVGVISPRTAEGAVNAVSSAVRR